MRKCFILADMFDFVVLELGLPEFECSYCRQRNYLLSTVDLLLITKNFSVWDKLCRQGNIVLFTYRRPPNCILFHVTSGEIRDNER